MTKLVVPADDLRRDVLLHVQALGEAPSPLRLDKVSPHRQRGIKSVRLPVGKNPP